MGKAMRPIRSAKSCKIRISFRPTAQDTNYFPEETKIAVKKICMIAYSYYLQDPRIRREAETLAQEGFRVDCFCLRKKGQPKFAQVNGVNIYRLSLSKYRGSTKTIYAWAYLRFFVLSFFAVTVSYFRQRYHIIQFHTLPDFIVFSGAIPKVFGAKLVLDMHEVMPEFFMSKFGVDMSNAFIRILKWIEKKSVQFSDATIVVNDPIRRVLIERCKPELDITVVMNTADEGIFGSGRPKCSTRYKKGFILMYHGTLTSIYGIEIAIRAIVKLKDQIPDLEFRIFGIENETGNLRKLAGELGVSNNVTFMGVVGIEAIPKYIEETDVGILPMVKDSFIDLSFSNKLAEYVSMKTPVVSTRLRSTLEYFTEDAISYFESGNVDALASRILELYTNPQKRLSKAEEAFRQYQRIRWPVMRERYVGLIRSLICR